jgi:hypothetical protein
MQIAPFSCLFPKLALCEESGAGADGGKGDVESESQGADTGWCGEGKRNAVWT